MPQNGWDKRRTQEIQRRRLLVTVKSLPGERWRDVKGCEGDYMVSNKARIKRLSRRQPNVHGTFSVKSEKIIKYSSKKNYPHVLVYVNGTKKYKLVHRLVAIAFNKNPYNKPEVNHKKGWIFGHFASNLEWVTKNENEQHAHRMVFKKMPFGELHYNAKLTDVQVMQIRKKYKWRVYTSVMLAKEYGVSQSHIILIIHGQHRKKRK